MDLRDMIEIEIEVEGKILVGKIELSCEHSIDQEAQVDNSVYRLGFDGAGVLIIVDGWDYYDAFLKLWKELSDKQIQMLCYGVDSRFRHSGMSRDMSGGLRGYFDGIDLDNVVGIFESGPGLQPRPFPNG